jgi:hypothetical protein
MNCPSCLERIHPPVSPERILGSPRLIFDLWLLRRTVNSDRPVFQSFGGSEELISGPPRISVHQFCRFRSLGLPQFRFHGWVDDEPRCPRTLHPQLAPRMNLRVQSGFADMPDERRFLNFSRELATGKPITNSCCPSILRRCPTRTAVQLPTGPPTEKRH